MANVAKYTRGACGHMLKHYERAKDERGEYIRFGNQDIDTSRSYLNYNLGPVRSGNQYSFIEQRCSEVYCLNRADVNVLCSWVVTAPKGLDPTEHGRFFRTAYNALEGKYGEENVVSAWVHQDESGQPHMHFAFVPVIWDAKKERYTVKAKDVISKAELKQFHPWLSEIMAKEFGRDIGIETGELGTRGNLTMEQYKTVQEANQKAQEAVELHREVFALEWKKAGLEADTERLEKQYRDAQRANEKVIMEQEKVLQLIQDYREYENEAKRIERDMDLLETATQELPKVTRLFKATEAKAWLGRMGQILKDIRHVISAGIKRLQIFERHYAVEKHLSEPIVERAKTLDQDIFKAALELIDRESGHSGIGIETHDFEL